MRLSSGQRNLSVPPKNCYKNVLVSKMCNTFSTLVWSFNVFYSITPASVEVCQILTAVLALQCVGLEHARFNISTANSDG